jgi:hypothetical protein
MFLPPGPTREDSFIFVGEKPLAQKTLPNQHMSDTAANRDALKIDLGATAIILSIAPQGQSNERPPLA